MSSFTSPLKVEYIDGKNWKLLEVFEYHVGEKESSEIIVVPAGFITDFASIPKIFWNILPPTGQWGKAAVIHDWLYRNRGWIRDGARENHYSRKACDEIFCEGMVVLNVPKFTRWIIYNAVRMFAGGVWKSYGKKAKR